MSNSAVGIFIFITAVFLFIYGSVKYDGSMNLSRRKEGVCHFQMSQLYQAVKSYFAEHPAVTRFPAGSEASGILTAVTAEYWGMDSDSLECRAAREDAPVIRTYEWNPRIAGGLFADWNHAHSPIFCDSMPHQYHYGEYLWRKERRRYTVLYGDGHYEYADKKPW
ncbi:MAG: hypothetical protein RL095_1215 [Verrucomicrobiota bacterium]|jgi:hypothetical protein